jgi:hypothetical protein
LRRVAAATDDGPERYHHYEGGCHGEHGKPLDGALEASAAAGKTVLPDDSFLSRHGPMTKPLPHTSLGFAPHRTPASKPAAAADTTGIVMAWLISTDSGCHKPGTVLRQDQTGKYMTGAHAKRARRAQK